MVEAAAKPRIRVPAWRATMDRRPFADGYQNLEARLGAGSDNLMDGAGYALSNLITRMPRQLEFMYRGSWIVGAVVDSIAEDMTRQGVDFGSTIAPDQIEALQGAQDDLQLWNGLRETVQWGRLYGGAIGVMQIDGQDPATPLNPKTIEKGQFKGILPLSRWELNPNVTDIVASLGPVIGKPEFYHVGPQATAMQMQVVHHSRVVRHEGFRLPYFQRIAEQGWGLSVVERMYDRLLAFDSATTGAAQLVFKAYLRTLKIKGLRQIFAAGGQAETSLIKNVDAIRRFQSTEGLTLIDAEDEFSVFNYTFAGLDDILIQFGQQISGATQIPMVRLFGQSPVGLSATGESDIRNYYDAIRNKQEADLRVPINVVMDLLYRSTIGGDPPEGFRATFNPCWQLSETEKATIAKTIGDAVGAAVEDGIIDTPTAMKELKQSSDLTGVFTNIEDADIAKAEKEAELEPPAPAFGDPGPAPVVGSAQPPPAAPGQPGTQVPGPGGAERGAGAEG